MLKLLVRVAPKSKKSWEFRRFDSIIFPNRRVLSLAVWDNCEPGEVYRGCVDILGCVVCTSLSKSCSCVKRVVEESLNSSPVVKDVRACLLPAAMLGELYIKACC